MAGELAEHYWCRRTTFDQVLAKLEAEGVHVFNQGGSFFVLKYKPEDFRGVWITLNSRRSSGFTEDVTLEVEWLIKNRGPDPQNLVRLAARFQELLLNRNAGAA